MTDTDDGYVGAWFAGPVKCLECGYEQVSVHPADLEFVQCGRCMQMTAAAFDWTQKKRKARR